MNVTLWIFAALLALFFVAAGFMKTFRTIAEIRKMPWAATMPEVSIRLIGIAELLGAVGLNVPLATGIAPVLTPIAATCLAILMVGAARTHQKLGDPKSATATTIVLAIACLVVAIGRFAGVVA
ncbi:MAG: hypothetical protein RLZ28_553 [Actinomycetota bacterium]|jgi:uncharacterized membrane protein